MERDLEKKADFKEWIAKGLIVLLIALVLMLIPVRFQLKDGGTEVYKAVLYQVTDWHALTSIEGQYKTGITVEILGLKVLEHTRWKASGISRLQIREEYQSLELSVGDTIQLAADVIWKDGSIIPEEFLDDVDLVWRESAPGGEFSVSEDGKITGLKEGIGNVSVYIEGKENLNSRPITVYVYTNEVH